MPKSILSKVLVAICLMLTATCAYPTSPRCYDTMLSIAVTGPSYTLDIVHVNNNIEAVEYALDLDRWSTPNITERVLGVQNITDTYSIYAQICLPDPAKDKQIMQILSHGAAFDHRYCMLYNVANKHIIPLHWLMSFLNIKVNVEIHTAQYSYVHAAVNAGYTVLNYDRLGSGLSDKPDAYTIVQGPFEVEVLRVLTEMARDGTLVSSSSGYTNDPAFQVNAFDKVVHVGHSFGSAVTLALLAEYGNLSSGAISTGFLISDHPNQDSTTVLGAEYAPSNNPELFGDRGSGYIVPATVSNVQTSFYRRQNASDPAGFINELLAYGESIKQPLTVAEWASLRGLLNIGYAPNFAGPLQFFLAEFDVLICSGDCKNNYDSTLIDELYPSATDVDFYIQPGAGHGLTFHRNASAGYAVMLDWLDSHGL